MDSFELNKIMGAVLGTLMFVMGVGFLAEAIYQPIGDRGPGYALPEPEVAESGGAAEAAPEVSLGVLLASASAERGAAAVRKCQSCHNFAEGEPNKQGPNLYKIVGASEAHLDNFAYSDALLGNKAEGKTWTYENLNSFLTSPKAYAPGTKMTFAGVRSPEERADILAYLQTLSPEPVPFPAAEEAPAESPAEGEAAPATDGTEPAAPAATTETPTTTAPETNVEGTPAAGGEATQAPAAAPATTSN